MKSLTRAVLIPLLMVSIITACTEETETGEEIIILHTNDHHGKINNFSKIVSLASKLRTEHSNVFLVCSGDIFYGNSVVDHHPTNGYPMIDLMNRAGYDICALGNKDFSYGQSNMNTLMDQADFPFLCGNLDSSSATLNQPAASKIMTTTAGTRILFTAAVQVNSDGYPSIHASLVQGIEFSNPTAAITATLNAMDDESISIALTHQGLAADIRLAEQLPRLDAILGGHSHSITENNYHENGVLLSMAGRDLHHISIIRLLYRDGTVVRKSSQLVALDSIQNEDPNTTSVISNYNFGNY